SNGVDHVDERPAADHRIEAEDGDRPGDPHPTDERPETRGSARESDRGNASDRVRAPPAPDRELHEHQGEDDQPEPQQVEDDESAAAVRADLIGELPDTAQADRRAHRGEDEAGAARPALGSHRRGGELRSSARRRTRLKETIAPTRSTDAVIPITNPSSSLAGVRPPATKMNAPAACTALRAPRIHTATGLGVCRGGSEIEIVIWVLLYGPWWCAAGPVHRACRNTREQNQEIGRDW